MSNIPTRETFENAYSGEAPWDIDGPQKPLVDAADRITGKVLDCGCGTGENALFFAAGGQQVTGIDYLPQPIERAKRKAAERKLSAKFEVRDALSLQNWPEQFDNVIDCGLFHVFTDEERPRYVAGLAHILKPGGRVFLMCFSTDEPGEFGPRRISQADLRQAFASGWQIDSIEPAVFAINPRFKDAPFTPGGPKAWFATIERT